MNLTWKLAGVLSGDLPESVLDTYEEERKPHARAMIRLAKLIGVSMTRGGKAGDLLRKAIAPRMHWIPGLRDRLLDGETPPLRRTGLVEGLGLRKSLNGRLCPNALLADGTRYDDVTRRGFVLVSCVPLSPQQRAVLAGRGTEVLEVEPGSPLYQWLEDGKAAAALVRPDFTVVRAGRDITELCEATPKYLVAAPARSTTPPATIDVPFSRASLPRSSDVRRDVDGSLTLKEGIDSHPPVTREPA
jgi:3-(3-hydroxy-phenyl)propionate hydroxylase